MSNSSYSWTKIFTTRKFKKIFKLIVAAVLVFFIVIPVFISPIAKYLIQKYGEKYTGRKITMDWAYVNPFTGYVHLQNLKIHEYKSDSLFLLTKGLSVHFALAKFLHHTFEIESLTLDHPVIKVIKDGKTFNFDDVIDKLSSSGNAQKKPSRPTTTKVNLLKLKVIEAEIHYTDKKIPFDYFIREANFETRGKHWDEDTMAIGYSFLSGPTRGGFKGEFHMNFKTSDYLIKARIAELDLKPLEQYVKDLVNYGTVRANLDADLLAKGNFHNAEDLEATGRITIDHFHFGKNDKEDYMAFDKLNIVIHELSPANRLYLLDDVTLMHPYVKYEVYDHSNNLVTMFGKKGAMTPGGSADKLNILVTIGRYIRSLSNDFFRSEYKVDNLAILKGELKYNDFSLAEEFSTGLSGLNITADSINKHHRRVYVFLKSALKPYGELSIDLNIDPKDSSNFDLNYHLRNLPLAMFNPYTITYTSYPMDRGSIEFDGAWHVHKGAIISDNHLLITDPRATKRIRAKDKKWIPVPLLFAFIRERGDVIDYKIPITGDLKSPKFHFHDVIMHTLTNIFVKPATTPYRFEVKNTEQTIEKSLMVKWPLMGSTLLPTQEKFLSGIAGFLATNKNARLLIQPFEYAEKEREYLIFFEAKKKYYLSADRLDPRSFSNKDSMAVNKMSVRDKGFMNYLNHKIRDTLLFTLQEKCARLVGSNDIDQRLRQLEKNRNEIFLSIFRKQQAGEQLKILPKKSLIPFDGFSYYEIIYEGSMPADLTTAYQKMNDLNEEIPRKKYLKEHKKSLP
ncbi:MAG TPA: DUF748 domain-containing protein [Puia sp.]|nr:DUF748 domain-containing protein [Puia sp.]